ncbi:MAG: WD40 repeat domain-containing protein [Bryobacteraceae bacterium]
MIVESQFSRDGRLLVTFGDVTAHIWDARGSKELYRLALDGKAPGACFSPDGKRLATARANGIVRLWDLTNGRELRQFNHGEWWEPSPLVPMGKC